jgi:DNA invertase Pin-like site-specific DNA recombinase
MVLDGYIRVSQVRGREKKGERFISPRVQREDIGRWVSAHGAELGEVFEELNKSGGRADRPRLLEAVDRVERGNSDGIVVARLTRFGRSFLDGLSLIGRIQKAGGTLVSVHEGFDLKTPTGQLVARILFAVGEWEFDQWREHWDVARENAIGRGIYICRKGPVGLRRGANGRLEVDPAQAPVMEGFFERRLDGASAIELAEYLNESEIETESGVPFTASSVYKFVKNPAYCGTAHSGAYSKAEAHEAIVDRATWERCQFPGRKSPEWVESLVAGMVRCAGCGLAMTSIRSQGQIAAANIYRCYGHRGKCDAPAIAGGEELDPLVEEFLFRHSQRGRPPGGEKKQQRLELAAAQAEADLVAYRDNPALQRTLGPESFEAGLAKRHNIVERRQLELARVKHGRRGPKVDLEALEREWPSLSWEARRKVTRELLDCVIVKRGSQPLIERAWIFRRDRGPIVDRKRRRIVDFRPPADGEARLKEPQAWGKRRIEAELREFFAEREQRWPTYVEFAKAGRARLHAQMMAWGGPYHWGNRLEIAVPRGAVRWTPQRLHGALAPLLEGRTIWPRRSEFLEAGVGPLYAAVNNNGGLVHWAEQFGLVYESPNGRTKWPKQRVERELRDFLSGRAVFPVKGEFKQAGLERLYRAMLAHGGRAYWAEQLNVKLSAGGRDRRDAAANLSNRASTVTWKIRGTDQGTNCGSPSLPQR